MAALTLLSQAETEAPLQQHLDLAPDVFSYGPMVSEEDPEPAAMIAEPVPPPQSTDKKRVKVYELRNNDWFDRGTGFCTAAVTVRSRSRRYPLCHLAGQLRAGRRGHSHPPTPRAN